MKVPATLVRTNKRPILAELILGDDVLYVVEVVAKGVTKYALGSKRKSGRFYWMIGPTDKVTLWAEMKASWDITVE